jgi:PKD repeat protein
MNARTWRMGTTLVLLMSLVAMAGWGQGVAPKGIIPTPPESTALQVSIWVDRGAYAVGESITIHYSVNKPAYVYIWDVTPDGQANQFFPNTSVAGGTANYVAAGEHTVPGSWQVAPPVGTEYLQILATTSPVDPFVAFTGDPQALQAQVEAQILGILPVTERTWNFTSFDIVQGSAPSYGRLSITSNPSGAAIYVDEEYVGYTPHTVYVPAGFRRVALVKSGYQTWQNALYVIAGLTRTLTVNLVATAPANQPPVSVFVYSPTSPAVGEWVQFNGSASTDPNGTVASYAWNFGDGTTATGAVIWHRFLASGNYAVALTVTDNQGASTTSSQLVSVGAMNQPPLAVFTNDPAVGIPGSWMQFDASASSDTDGTIGAYSWNFGDGTTGTGSVLWHRYTSAGSYSVVLTVTDNLGASTSVTRVILVGTANQPPIASFVVPTAPSVGSWARFDATASSDPDGTIVSYLWAFGDGATGTGNVVYHQFAAAGTFSVTLTVADNGGATNSITQLVAVGTPLQAPVAAFTYSPSSPVVGSPVVFNASTSYDPDGTIVSYQWDLNGDGSTDATGVTGQVIYSTPGTAIVQLTVTDNSGLTAYATRTIAVSASGGGSSGAPAMGATAGFFVWGSDTWHITVNAGAGWTSPHNFRIELRTDGQFTGVNEVWSGGVAPMGIIPTPSTSGKTVVFESSIQSGSVDYTFTIPGAKSMWMSFKMDTNGDGTLEESTSSVYLRAFMVHPTANPFVVGMPSGTTGNLIPSLNFRIGTAWAYTETSRLITYSTTIGALESL